MLDGHHFGHGAQHDGTIGAAKDGHVLQGHDEVDVGLAWQKWGRGNGGRAQATHRCRNPGCAARGQMQRAPSPDLVTSQKNSCSEFPQ